MIFSIVGNYNASNSLTIDSYCTIIYILFLNSSAVYEFISFFVNSLHEVGLQCLVVKGNKFIYPRIVYYVPVQSFHLLHGSEIQCNNNIDKVVFFPLLNYKK